MQRGTPIPPERLGWLEAESARWEAEGILDAAQAAAIRDRYRPDGDDAPAGRRPVLAGSATGVVVGLGGLLAAAGIVLLVAANVDFDTIGPLARVLGVAAVWLAAVAAAELGVGRVRALAILRGPLRAVAVAAYGATVFQVAQSLQVPAFEVWLLVAWALGSLAYAYAVGSAGALVLAVGVGVAACAFAVTDDVDTSATVVLGLGAPAPLLLAVAAAHHRTSLGHLAGPWRAAGALVGLVALGSGAIPGVLGDGDLPAVGVVTVAVGLAACAVLAARGTRDDRLEAAVGAALGVGLLVLVVIAPGDTTDPFSSEAPDGAQVAFTLVGVLIFVSSAVGLALLGIRRRAPAVGDLAAAGLVLFIVLQSFGVLAPLASGAALVLLLGVLLVAAGVLVDRGRRRLREDLAP